MIYNFSNYSEYLKGLLIERQKVNASYSLRAMAKNIGVSIATLSDVINERKNLSEEKALQVCQKLKLTGRKAKYFITLVQYKITKNPDLKLLLTNQLRVLNPKLREHFDIDLDRFRFISDWYHTAILEMTYLTNQSMSVESISKKLDISITQVSEALDLLKRLELIEVNTSGKIQKTQNQFKIQTVGPNHALRKFHHQMLEKAQNSLHTQTNQERFVGSETFPMNVEDLEAANDIIELCFQQILELSKKSNPKKDVYHMGIQLFRLTKT